MNDGTHLLDLYRQALRGLPVSHTWRGAGSAIFLEFGNLTPKQRRDGSAGEPDGELTLMIEWSWRIEESNCIACGSWNDDEIWVPWLSKLVGNTVTDITTFGRLPEIILSLSKEIYVSSFMISASPDGNDPEWSLMDHRQNCLPTLVSRKGLLCPEPQEEDG